MKTKELPKFERGSRKGAVKFGHRIAVAKGCIVLATQTKNYRDKIREHGPSDGLDRDIAVMNYCQKLLKFSKPDPTVENLPTAHDEVREMRRELERVVFALHKYGEHRSTCAVPSTMRPCTCGLDDILGLDSTITDAASDQPTP